MKLHGTVHALRWLLPTYKYVHYHSKQYSYEYSHTRTASIFQNKSLGYCNFGHERPGVEYKHTISPCNKMNGVNHLQNCHAANKQKMGGWKWPGKNSYPLSIPSTYVQNIPQLLWSLLLHNNWYTIHSTGTGYSTDG